MTISSILTCDGRLATQAIASAMSVAVNGVSLTINGVSGARFDVMLVPYTLDHTTFGQMQPGHPVNLEVDILAKYVASLLGKPGVDAPDA